MGGMDYDHLMGEALMEAEEALAHGEFPVGCVLVHGGRILARGRRTGTAGEGRNELDHAEVVALRNLVGRHAAIEFASVTAFCTMEPCLMCFAAFMLHGVGEVVFAYEDVMGGGTGCEVSHLSPLYRQRRMRLRPHVRRKDSLLLFKTFFADPSHAYWRGSLLAEYTLRQG
jgi:tRNA(adenine34) deaminase